MSKGKHEINRQAAIINMMNIIHHLIMIFQPLVQMLLLSPQPKLNGQEMS